MASCRASTCEGLAQYSCTGFSSPFNLSVCLFVCLSVYLSVCSCTDSSLFIDTYIHACIHTYIHASSKPMYKQIHTATNAEFTRTHHTSANSHTYARRTSCLVRSGSGALKAGGGRPPHTSTVSLGCQVFGFPKARMSIRRTTTREFC